MLALKRLDRLHTDQELMSERIYVNEMLKREAVIVDVETPRWYRRFQRQVLNFTRHFEGTHLEEVM